MTAEPQRLTNTGSDKAAGGPRDARSGSAQSKSIMCVRIEHRFLRTETMVYAG